MSRFEQIISRQLNVGERVLFRARCDVSLFRAAMGPHLNPPLSDADWQDLIAGRAPKNKDPYDLPPLGYAITSDRLIMIEYDHTVGDELPLNRVESVIDFSETAARMLLIVPRNEALDESTFNICHIDDFGAALSVLKELCPEA